MKKTILLMSLFLLTSIMTFAVPALPGIWHNITLEDGTTVYAQLKGDETVNFYEDKEGNIYMANEDGTYCSHRPTPSRKRQASAAPSSAPSPTQAPSAWLAWATSILAANVASYSLQSFLTRSLRTATTTRSTPI